MQRLFTVLLALPLFLGIAIPARSTTPTHATAVAHPPAATVSDAQIDAKIKAKLAKSKIGKDGFKYHVQHGIVTWEGTTGVIQHKGSATRMAKTAGARQVVNNIQISDAARAKAAANLKKAVVQQ
jgi:osmotically-inducible protein OsmY